MNKLPQRISPRRSDYDYGSPGGYFVTICTAGRQHYFGEVIGGNMILNDLGNICIQQIKQLEITRLYIEIHEFVIMPNHIHLLLLLWNWRRGRSVTDPIRNFVDEWWNTEDVLWNNNTEGGLSTRPYEGPSLPSVIQSLKANISKEIIKQWVKVPFNDQFARQRSFHDHIIRNQQSYDQIKYYIQTNPQNREEDMFNK
jgi:putative transposase